MLGKWFADLKTLLDRLTAARAALLDQITALRLAELDAANIPADVDTIKAKTNLIPASPASVPTVEQITFAPGVRDSGDVVAADKLITATTEAAGTGNADYNAALTLTAPSDARLAVLQIAARLNIQGSVLGTPSLRCRVYVDAQDANHRLFDSTVGVSTNYLEAVDTHAAALATIFALLKDGAAHTFYFFFWDPNYVAGTHTYTVSLAQLWEGVGTRDTDYWGLECLTLAFTGMLRLDSAPGRIGTGTVLHLWTGLGGASDRLKEETGAKVIIPLAIVFNSARLRVSGSVATDLNYLGIVIVTLRSG